VDARILALGVILLVPAAGLLAEIGDEARQHFELREAGEGFDSASKLQVELEVIDCPYKAAQPIRLPRPIAPRPMRKLAHAHGLGSQLLAHGVFVVARETADRLLNFNK